MVTVADGSQIDHWTAERSRARISWQDERGVEHLCVATEEA
jgi:hypothetical protein